MRGLLRGRPGHYLLLAAVHLALTLPNLGAYSLFDMDEGVNAEAAREMVEGGDWITPHFNYALRTAKPAFLYWLQSAAFLTFGVTEFAARLPSVLCGLGTVLLTYELGRKMFSPATGVFSGLALTSCIEFCLISHAATPDPPLILFTTLAFTLYYVGSSNGARWWPAASGAAMGLAVLAKGPVGAALPFLVIVLHLASTKSLREITFRRVLTGAATCFAVFAPWYILVTIATRGKWPKAFFLTENINRASQAMEGHQAGSWFHAALLFVLFAPWSVFLIVAMWQAIKMARRPLQTDADDSPRAYRFLLIWIGLYLVVFSAVATKLPNYVLPLYPAIAIATGRFLDRWRSAPDTFSRWLMPAGIAGLFLTGAVTVAGLLIAGGAYGITVKGVHPLPALGGLAWIGGIPLLTAAICAVLLWRRPKHVTCAFAAGAAAFLGCLAAFAPPAMERYKAPKYFAHTLGLKQTDRDVRIGAYGWFRESLVFYAEREVTKIQTAEDINVWLRVPMESYILIRDRDFAVARSTIMEKYREVGRHYDVLSREDVVVISNFGPDGEFLSPVVRP